MLSACTAAQKPFVIGSSTQATTFANTAANTPGTACQLHNSLNFNNSSIDSYTQHLCKPSKQNAISPIIKVCEPLQNDLPIDYSVVGAFWAFGFTGVMILYFTSHVIGLVIKAVRDF